jgi:hypothetical protein
MSDSRQVGACVPALMHYALVALAKSEGRSVSAIIKDFIDEGLRRQAALPREAKPKKRKPKR